MASDAPDVGDAGEKQCEADVQRELQRLTAAGHAALQTGDNAAALRCFRNALKTATQLREKRLQRTCAFNLGAAYVQAGRPQEGLDLLSRAQPGDRGERVADLQFNLATAHEALGDQSRAARHFLQAAQLYRSQGDAGTEGDACIRLAHCHLRKEEWDEAAQVFQRAAESYRTAGNMSAAAQALKDAGKNMLRCDCYTSDDVITALTSCLEMSSGVEDQDGLGKLLMDVALIFSQMKMFPEACECFHQALPLVSSRPQRLAALLQNLGAVHNTLGQFQQALGFSRDAAALHGSLGCRGAQGWCFSNLGFALVALGELDEAWESYLHAQQAFRDTDDPAGQWQACEGLAGIKLQMKDPERAVQYYKDALRLLSRCQEAADSVQERLVTQLTDALQQQLLMQSRRAAMRQRTRHHHRVVDSRPDTLPQRERRETPEGEKQHSTDAAADGTSSRQMMLSSESRHDPEVTEDAVHRAQPEANRNLNNTYENPESQQQKVLSNGSADGEESDESGRQRSDTTNRSAIKSSKFNRTMISRFCSVM